MSYFGKYRAVVLDNADPNGMGRVRVKCPRVYGEGVSPWALPCTPYAFSGGGLCIIPKVGSGVWVEFEEGKPALPIWVGSWWTQGGVPPEATDVVRIGKFENEAKMTVDATKLKIELGSAKVTLGAASTILEFGSAKLTLNATSTILEFGSSIITMTATSMSISYVDDSQITHTAQFLP